MTSACLDRMPGPIVQASPGGTSPRTINNIHVSNHHHIEILGTVREEGVQQESQDDHQHEDHCQDHHGDHCQDHQDAVWVLGSLEDDKQRYRDLMAYMEEKRVEAKELLREERERKEIAKKKEESWTLLRMSISFLKHNEEGWKLRKMKECERIREEEKQDRLALAREKKRKYGIKKISKEENQRLKKRTGERLEIASAKANLWKKFREGGEDLSEREVAAWEAVRTSVMELEEDGRWRNPEEGDEKLEGVHFVMRRGELLGGGHVRDEDKVEGGAREGDAEGAQDQVDEMGNRDQAGHDLERGQGQHGGRGNPKEHNKIQGRGIKRGLCEGGHDDQSVSAREISRDASISSFGWGEGGGQDQGGLVQGGEPIHGGEGIKSN